MSTTLTRGVVAVTGSALALSLGLAIPSAQAAAIAAPVGADPAPAAAAAAYLAAQPGANSIIKTVYGPGPTDSYDDYGLTIDAAYGLDAVGGQSAKLAAMTTALETNADSYYNAFSGTGAAAKLSAFLQSQGRSNAVVTDLVDAVEDHISTLAPTGGRLEDADDPGTPYDDDFNSPLTQAFAVSSLNNASSTLAPSALGFLLDQQCTAGFFRASFSAKAASDQTCNGAASPTPSVDTTGLSVLMLQDQKSKPAVSASLTKALNWLASQQAANGSFSGGNANATGLAGWALGISGRTAEAAKAAGWLRGQQLANAGSCTKYAAKDNGAVTLDALGLTNAAGGPLSAVDTSTTTRATTQALPALLWAPGGAAAGDTKLTGPTGFVPAGSAQSVALLGAPGNTLCVTSTGTPTRVVLDATGKGTVPVTVPAATGKLSVVAVDAGGETDTLSVQGLAQTKLDVDLKKSKVAQGGKIVVKVSGLAEGETVTVSLGKQEVEAVANAAGKVKVKLAATKVGKGKVKAVGAFANRKGKKAVTVTK